MTFIPDVSGNPRGRRPGVRTRKAALVEALFDDEIQAVGNKCLELAKDQRRRHRGDQGYSGSGLSSAPTISRTKLASELFSNSVRRLIISSVIVGCLVRVKGGAKPR